MLRAINAVRNVFAPVGGRVCFTIAAVENPLQDPRKYNKNNFLSPNQSTLISDKEKTVLDSASETLKADLEKYSEDVRANAFEYTLGQVRDHLTPNDVAALSKKAMDKAQPAILNILAKKFPETVNIGTLAGYFAPRTGTSSELIFGLMALHEKKQLASSLEPALQGSPSSPVHIADGNDVKAMHSFAPHNHCTSIFVEHRGSKYDGEVVIVDHSRVSLSSR